MAVILERVLHGGTQVVHKFENGFGASVVSHDFSYGSALGLFELAVLEFPYKDNTFHLCYSTEVTDDVLGHLEVEDVKAILARIEALEVK
ncbi:TerC family protein [Pseudomonas phage PPSC2]|uniref:TerC family protein n=1 Tax=Pseudomonas phage PPSC2 TaxID=2041350 RepID=A0A2R2YAV1_9CAUD|nr:TerC family protein [Pseudomonas phage PPSC2]ATN92895.1 TerC family protein [Pseudomonas phage PPSC2]